VQKHIASIFRAEEEAKKGTTINQATRRAALLSPCFLGLLLNLEDGGDMFLRKMSALTSLHGVISQKVELFMAIAVRTLKAKFVCRKRTVVDK
jgi:hypothetical protein